MPAQALGGENHQQRLAGPLKMPDEAFLRAARHHAFDDLVAGFVLLVAADQLNFALVPIRGEHGEMMEDAQNDLRGAWKAPPA